MTKPIITQNFDPIGQFKQGMRSGPPWEDIVTFATHKSFCGKRLYPRQMTLLKLIYLETETMTDYDREVISGWAETFKDFHRPVGVQPDIWDRINYLKSNNFTHFPHVQMVMGRRASKGIMGGIVGAERIAWLYSLGSWQQHFNQVPGQVAEVMVVANSLSQAVTRQFRDIRNTVLNCEYLRPHIVSDKQTEFYIRTPGDEQTIAENKIAGITTEREIATIYCKASSSVSTSGRGGTAIAIFYDEMAHMLAGTGSTKTGEEIYDAFQPSLDQFGSAAMTYLASSPFSKIGKFYELYQQGRITMDEYNQREGKLKTSTFIEEAAAQDIDVDPDEVSAAVAEPTFLVVQLPSWETYKDWDRSRDIPIRPGRTRMFPRWNSPVQYEPKPDGTPDERVQYRRMQRNPDKFKVERGAQFATVQDAYLNEVMVDRMFTPPGWRPALECQYQGKLALAYRAHADPSRTNANFGFAIAHLEDAPPDEHGIVWPHVIIDVLKVWKPEDFPEHTIDYVRIGEELDDYLTRFPSIAKMTYDQFNSAGFIAHQKRAFPNIRVLEKTFTVKENQDRFEKFKSALNLGWVHCLAGETAVLTPEGPRPIRDLAGTTARLLTTSQADGRGGGKWVDAPVRSFGVQPLLKVTLRRNGVDKTIHATAGHRWFVRQTNGTASHRDEVLTTDLKPGQKLSYCYEDKQRKDYRGYTVVAVEETDRVEEVFCAVVDGTHSFTLEDNILTGNCYKDDFAEEGQSLLELELKFLQEKNGKVDRQEIGPVQTKDLADAVMVVTTELLHESLDRWWTAINRTSVGSTNVDGLRAGREQERLLYHETSQGHYTDPLQRYLAEEASKSERRAIRAERNKAALERSKIDRARRNSMGYRLPYTGDRTRGQR